MLTGTEAKIALAQREDARYNADAPRSRATAKRSSVATDVPIPVPPFWGSQVVDAVPLDDVFAFVNEVALIRGQWQVRKGKLTEDAYRALLAEKVHPVLNRLKQQCKDENAAAAEGGVRLLPVPVGRE